MRIEASFRDGRGPIGMLETEVTGEVGSVGHTVSTDR